MNVWDKLTRLVIVLSLVAAVVAEYHWYCPVIEKNQNLRQRRLSLEQEIEKEKKIGEKLDASFRAMEDPRTIERLARETWCYAKPGETVIHFDTPAPLSNGPAQTSK